MISICDTLFLQGMDQSTNKKTSKPCLAFGVGFTLVRHVSEFVLVIDDLDVAEVRLDPAHHLGLLVHLLGVGECRATPIPHPLHGGHSHDPGTLVHTLCAKEHIIYILSNKLTNNFK